MKYVLIISFLFNICFNSIADDNFKSCLFKSIYVLNTKNNLAIMQKYQSKLAEILEQLKVESLDQAVLKIAKINDNTKRAGLIRQLFNDFNETQVQAIILAHESAGALKLPHQVSSLTFAQNRKKYTIMLEAIPEPYVIRLIMNLGLAGKADADDPFITLSKAMNDNDDFFTLLINKPKLMKVILNIFQQENFKYSYISDIIYLEKVAEIHLPYDQQNYSQFFHVFFPFANTAINQPQELVDSLLNIGLDIKMIRSLFLINMLKHSPIDQVKINKILFPLGTQIEPKVKIDQVKPARPPTPHEEASKLERQKQSRDTIQQKLFKERERQLQEKRKKEEIEKDLQQRLNRENKIRAEKKKIEEATQAAELKKTEIAARVKAAAQMDRKKNNNPETAYPLDAPLSNIIPKTDPEEVPLNTRPEMMAKAIPTHENILTIVENKTKKFTIAEDINTNYDYVSDEKIFINFEDVLEENALMNDYFADNPAVKAIIENIFRDQTFDIEEHETFEAYYQVYLSKFGDDLSHLSDFLELVFLKSIRTDLTVKKEDLFTKNATILKQIMYGFKDLGFSKSEIKDLFDDDIGVSYYYYYVKVPASFWIEVELDTIFNGNKLKAKHIAGTLENDKAVTILRQGLTNSVLRRKTNLFAEDAPSFNPNNVDHVNTVYDLRNENNKFVIIQKLSAVGIPVAEIEKVIENNKVFKYIRVKKSIPIEQETPSTPLGPNETRIEIGAHQATQDIKANQAGTEAEPVIAAQQSKKKENSHHVQAQELNTHHLLTQNSFFDKMKSDDSLELIKALNFLHNKTKAGTKSAMLRANKNFTTYIKGMIERGAFKQLSINDFRQFINEISQLEVNHQIVFPDINHHRNREGLLIAQEIFGHFLKGQADQLLGDFLLQNDLYQLALGTFFYKYNFFDSENFDDIANTIFEELINHPSIEFKQGLIYTNKNSNIKKQYINQLERIYIEMAN